MDQFPGVDTDRGNSHTRAHNGDGLAVVGAGKAQHVADFIELDDIFQEGIRDEFGAEGIAGQQNGLCDGGAMRIDVRGGNLGLRHGVLLNVDWWTVSPVSLAPVAPMSMK